MSQINNQIELNHAMVTPKGIKFQNLYYTNASMVRRKWFELAGRDGVWEIPVLYQSADLQYIVIFDSNEIKVATTVEVNQQMDEELLQKYYNTLQELKQQYLIRNKKI